MKDIEKDHKGILLYLCHIWFIRLGLYETEWILNNDGYVIWQGNGHKGTYKEIVLERKTK